MTTPTRCENCGNRYQPADLIVRGLAPRSKAPRMFDAWTAILAYLRDEHPDCWVSLSELRDLVQETIAASTVGNLCAAAARIGILKRHAHPGIRTYYALNQETQS